MLSDAKILVIGNGRIGRVLMQQLQALGAEVRMASRVPGPGMVLTGQYGPFLSQCDAIVNTAPALVVTQGTLERTRKDCLILDLASEPGGVDFDAAAALGRHVRWELGLPGRCFPDSAGRIIAQTVLRAWSERGE